MKALILAAGRGTRMDQLTANQPKCFTKLAGKRLIDWQIDSLQKANIRIENIAVVTGYLSEKFEEYNLKSFFNADWSKSNMVLSLLKASSFIDHEAIISYSDIVYHPKAIESLKKTDQDIVLAYDKNWHEQWKMRFENPENDAESFSIDSRNIVTDIGDNIDSIHAVEGQYTGLFKLTKKGMLTIQSLLEQHPQKINDLDMTALFQLMIKEGIKIYGVDIKSNWFEIDTSTDLNIAESLYNSRQLIIS